MGFTSIWHWLIVLIIVVILFGGRGKLSSLMGDLGTGLRNFKRGMNKEDGDLSNADSKQIEGVVDVSSDFKTEQKENVSKKNQ